MKKNEIRAIFSRTIADMLADGYMIFPDTMAGSEGEIAKVDLIKDGVICRVMLTKRTKWDGNYFYGNVLTLMVGKAATRIGDSWNSVIWNDDLEVLRREEWVAVDTADDWVVSMEEARRISKVRYDRTEARLSNPEPLGDKYKAPVLKWLRKQAGMKSCKGSEIVKIERRTWRGRMVIFVTAREKTLPII